MDAQGNGPLVGLRIIDISTYVAGPSATMALAQLGADVIRIDPVGGATDTKRLPLGPTGESLYWAGLNKGKRTVEIDLRSEDGRELVRALVADAGVLVTNAIGRPWLTYQRLVERCPDLIMVHILGYPDGRPAVDYTVNSEVGLPLITGPSDLATPVNHVLPAWDLLTGQQAALGVLAAHMERSQTGRGQYVPIALADVAVATMAHLGFVADVVVNGLDRVREGNYLYGNFGCDVRTQDGRRLMVVALTGRHWHALVETTGAADVIAALERSLGTDFADEEVRYEHSEVIAAVIRPWFTRRSFDEVTRVLDRSGVLWGPYRTIAEMVADSDSVMNRSKIMTPVAHSSGCTYPTPRSALGFSAWQERSAMSAHFLGADTTEVLANQLGISTSGLAELRARGVVGGSDVLNA